MKSKSIFIPLNIFILIVLMNPKSSAQINTEEFIIPRTNSKAVVHQTIASTKIEISYNRPNKRGRKIYGQLVPFDQVWRTGADESTKIYFNTPISFEGHFVDSGQYELFTIPGEQKWAVILQKNQNQWGSYRYNPEKDVIKFYVTPIITGKTIETFTISVDSIGSNYAVLHVSWENTVVPIELRVDLKQTVIPLLEKSLEQDSVPSYFQAAMFYYENVVDINRAASLMELALERKPGHIGMLYRYALILREKGEIQKAIKASERSFEAAQKAGPELKEEYTRLNSILLNELRSLKK